MNETRVHGFNEPLVPDEATYLALVAQCVTEARRMCMTKVNGKLVAMPVSRAQIERLARRGLATGLCANDAARLDLRGGAPGPGRPKGSRNRRWED